MYPTRLCVSKSFACLMTAALVLLGTAGALSDSMESECGFSNSGDIRPTSSLPCVFSQRQGYISVTLEDGSRFEFSPVGDGPGNYLDQDGKAVYRLSGLNEEGQLFRLPRKYLYVFWCPFKLECSTVELQAPGGCPLGDGRVRFSVQATAEGSLNTLRVKPQGLELDNNEISQEIDGMAYRAELADLDANGWPEIYIYVSSAGSGSYGSLVAYAVNGGKSLSPIYLPPMEQSPSVVEGYMGHDEFSVVESSLVRRFPIYLRGDTNAKASGGTRQLQYKLIAGEAGWVMEVDRVVEY